MSESTSSLGRLESLSRLVSRGGSTGQVLAASVHVIQRWFSAEWCAVFVQATDTTRPAISASTQPTTRQGSDITAANALAAQVVETGETQVDGSLIGAPMVLRGTCRGALLLRQTAVPAVEDVRTTLGLAAMCLAPVLRDDAVAPPTASRETAETLRTLSRRIAHALNNSLMPIVGHAELMLEDARRLDNRDLEEGCLAIRDNGYEAARLVRELLELGAQPPASAVDVARPASVVSVVSPGLPRFESHRVLVVDDDDRMLELIDAVLSSKLGCRVDRASNGADAASAIDHINFSLVLSDVLMPRMNGLELLHWIDRHRPQVAERLVFMTGDANPKGPGDELRRAGRQVLAKPFSLDTLVAVAEAVLQQTPSDLDTGR